MAVDQQLAQSGDVNAMMRQGQRVMRIADAVRHPINMIVDVHTQGANNILAAEESGHWFNASVDAGEIGSADAAAVMGAAEGATGITRFATGVARRAGLLEIAVQPIPARLARVVPADVLDMTKTLARAGDADAFVTPAEALAGMSSSEEIANALRLLDNKGNLIRGPLGVIEFDTPAQGIASPIFRKNPGFVGKGLTGRGLPEFVLPNLFIEELQNVIKRVIP
jgi:Novel toxin 10